MNNDTMLKHVVSCEAWRRWLHMCLWAAFLIIFGIFAMVGVRAKDMIEKRWPGNSMAQTAGTFCWVLLPPLLAGSLLFLTMRWWYTR